MSYEKCLVNLKLSGLINGKEIQDAAEAYVERGQSKEQALISAVQWKITELEQDRTKVVATVRKAYGKAAPVEIIQDVGEKIGGARKDTAVSTGPKKGRASTEEDTRPTWAKRFQVSQVAKGFDMSVNGRDITGKWTISDLRTKDRLGQPQQLGRYFDSKEDAEAALPLLAVAQKHRVLSGAKAEDGTYKQEIWRDINDRKRVKVVDQEFATREEAMRYMAQHAQEILDTNTTFGESDIPKPESTQRKGVERRTGDVNGEDFRDAFGMRAVEFGNWNNQDERQEVMNAAYDGLMDLADVLGVPPKAIGLNGDLALAFGARGHGLSSARAHYERDRVVMNLTKMNGAGALAHEWFHALDHYLARQDGKTTAEWKVNKDGTRSLDVHGGESDMASGGFRTVNSGVREELRDAYTSLVQSLFTKAEQYVEDTARADKFVAVARGELEKELGTLRADLASQLDVRYYKRNNKPASAEQLAEFDTLAAELVEGRGLSTEWKHLPGKTRLAIQSRHTNETLEKLNEIYKAVRGRSGFNAERRGVIDALTGYMKRYDQRMQMLREANALTTKTKRVPTSFAMDAKSLDQGRGGDYWTSPPEMVARAFQGYVEDAIAAKDGKSPFLNYAPEGAAILTPWGAKRPFPSGDERKAMNGEFDKFIGAIKTKETDKGVAMFSREQSAGLQKFKEADELFALPKSAAKDLEKIAKDNGAEVSIRTTNFPGGETMHTLTFDDGTAIRITDRKASPYGQDKQVYGMEMVDGEAKVTQLGRPGENPEDVPPTDDVWLDVSDNTPAKWGAKAYSIAMTYAYNNGRIFIGDPNGLKDKALRRRTEQMLSSALKFGTTEHLAPHPRQVEGDSALGVPPLRWVYGDHVGNIERMIDVSLESLDNGASGAKDDTFYNADTGEFADKGGKVVPRKSSMGRDMAAYRDGVDQAQAGWRTLARAAFLRSFVGPNGRAEGSGILDRAGDHVARLSSDGVGGGAYPATERIFYARGERASTGLTPAQFTTNDANRETTDKLEAAIKRQGHDFTVTPVSLPLDVVDDAGKRGDNKRASPSNRYALAERLAGVFGKEVVWITTEGPFTINGVVIGGGELSNYIFINANAKLPAHVILGHELTHHIEKDAPGVYRELVKSLTGLLRNHEGYRAKYGMGPEHSDAAIVKEMIGDLMGDNFDRREFWNRVSQESNGTYFKMIAHSVMKWLDALLVKLKLKGFGSDQFVTNIHAARKALATAIADYAETKGNPARSEDGSIAPAFNRGTNDAMTNPDDVVGNQGGRSADDTTPGDYPKAKGIVDGLEVRDDIPNRGSIRAELEDYDILPSVREVPFSAFTQMGKLKYYSVSEEARTKRLAQQIKDSGEINPLIVVIDKEGPYVLEGGHRFDALRELGKTSFPALVVLDNDSLNEPTAPDSGGAFSRKVDQTQTEAFRKWFGKSAVVDADGKPLVVYHGTSKDFDAFVSEKQGGNFDDYEGAFPRDGFWFTDSPNNAAWYAHVSANGLEGERSGGGQKTLPVFLSIKNPYRYTAEMFAEEGEAGIPSQYDLESQGYDGLIVELTKDDESASKAVDEYVDRMIKKNGGAYHTWSKTEQEGLNKLEDATTVRDHTHYVAFKPEQIKSATGNNGDFDGTNPDIRFSRAKIVGQTNRQHTPEQLRAMANVGFQVEVPTLKERAQALWKDAGKKIAQGIVDQFAPVKSLDKEAYGLLRLAKGASGAFEAFLRGGRLKLTDGVYDFDDANKGGVVDKLLIPLQGEHHDFFRWVAANRAERLTAEGKENLFSPQDIADLKTLADGTADFDYTIQNGTRSGQVTRDRTLIYADSLKTFNEFNTNILDLAEQSGLIDGESRKLWEHEFYVPFYRVADEESGGVRGMNIKGSVVRQEAFKTLKGGKNALNADLLDNTLMNWAHLLDASAKNRAAKATIEAAERMGAATTGNQSTLAQMGASIHNKHGVVWFMDQGQKRFSLVDDPYLMTAITSLEYAGMRNPVMNAMGAMKHALTVGVTASPFFKVRNLIRDSVQVIGTSGINVNAAANIKEGWKLTDPKSDAYFRLLAGGGTIHFGTMLEGSEAKRVQALVESGVDDATILNSEHKVKAFYRKYLEPGITAYNELGNRGEAINRAALYDQLRKQGMNHADASLQARDLMDFSMQGSFATIRFLTQVVPFFNARIQGLYKLGRAAKEDPARFSAVVGAAALASIGLMAAYSDDDDWKKREEWDRNNFFWFKFGGMAFRIPRPFEIGAIATLAERGFELAFDKEMTGERFRKQVLTILGDNLSMNPVPQLVKPIMDVYANKDSFSGRPIETMGMDKLKSEYRFTDRTSMTARAASTGLNAITGLVGAEALSPVQVDHMLRGYFGWLGAFVVGAGDIIARPATGQNEHPSSDMWKVATGGMASDLRDAPSRYVSQMYTQAKELEQAYGTWRALQKEGKTLEAQEFAQDNRDKLAKYRGVEAVKRAEAKFNERIRLIERSNMDADAKRDLIRTIQVQKDRVARAVM